MYISIKFVESVALRIYVILYGGLTILKEEEKEEEEEEHDQYLLLGKFINFFKFKKLSYNLTCSAIAKVFFE